MRPHPIACVLALSLMLSSAVSAQTAVGAEPAVGAETDGGARTSGYRSQWAVQDEGAEVVKVAVHHDVAGAFTRAAGLTRPWDENLRSRLTTQQREVETAASALGALRSVAPAQEMVFAGCVTHRYLVRYAEGRQQWMLKYRRGTNGWYLTDLYVESAS